jgi:hypothetical protein
MSEEDNFAGSVVGRESEASSAGEALGGPGNLAEGAPLSRIAPGQRKPRQPKTNPADNLSDAIRRRVEPLGGTDLPPFPRGPIREPPDFTA